MRPNLEKAIADRRGVDDIVTTAYWHDERAIVVRLVRENAQGFAVIFDDEGTYVRRRAFKTIEQLLSILKSEPDDDPSFNLVCDRVLAAYRDDRRNSQPASEKN